MERQQVGLAVLGGNYRQSDYCFLDMKASMLKEFAHFHPHIVQIIRYTIGSYLCNTTQHTTELIAAVVNPRTSNAGPYTFTILFQPGTMARLCSLVMLPTR